MTAPIWDHVTPGDPRPLFREGDPCHAQHDAFWLCTRDVGHTGQHVAAGEHRVFACWPLIAAATPPGSERPSPVAGASGDHLPPGGEPVVTTAAPGDGNPDNKEHA